MATRKRPSSNQIAREPVSAGQLRADTHETAAACRKLDTFEGAKFHRRRNRVDDPAADLKRVKGLERKNSNSTRLPADTEREKALFKEVPRVIETHTIDLIPVTERRGCPWHLFTLWFGANSVITSVVIAAALVSAGAGFGWSVLAIFIGFGLGTILSAFHAAQGPHMGIPQMIQSRAQFGYHGGVIPMVIALANFLIFFGAAASICGLIAGVVWGWNVYVVTVVVTIITFAVALFGYDVTHQAGKYLSVAAVLVFGIFTVLLVTHHGIDHRTIPNLHGGFSLGLFLTGVAVTFIYGAGYAPYIADYSRYLPTESSTAATAWWTYLGIFLSGTWLFVLGAYLTSITGFGVDTLSAIIAVTGGRGSVFTAVFTIVVICVQILQGSLCMYSGGNTIISIATSLRCHSIANEPRLDVRLMALAPYAVICLAAAVVYSKSFTTAFTDALGVILILLIPWSAINLTDFYFVRRGRYDIIAIFDPDGIYCKVNIAGLVSFLLGFIAEIPFANLGFYQGPIARILDGGDLSWAVGILVSGSCYLLMIRSRRRAGEAMPYGQDSVSAIKPHLRDDLG